MTAGDIPGTLPITENLQNAVSRATRVLDIGCACGRLPTQLKRPLGSIWTGLDINPDAISKARARLLPAAEFYVHDILTPWSNAANPDLVVLNGILTCLPCEIQRARLFKNLAQIVRDGAGRVYVADFLQTWTESCHSKRYEHGIQLGLERGSFLVEDGSRRLLYIARHFTEREIKDLFAAVGLNLLHFQIFSGHTRSGKKVLTFEAMAK